MASAAAAFSALCLPGTWICTGMPPGMLTGACRPGVTVSRVAMPRGVTSLTR